MRLYENRNSPRNISCGYCYEDGHSKNNCPTLKAHWENNKHLEQTITLPSVPMTKQLTGDFSSLSWIRSDGMKVRFIDEWDYCVKKWGSQATTRKKKKRKPSKCGFCGRTTHTRRNCTHMNPFLTILNETNRAYREQWYDLFAEQMGFGVGALVQMRRGVGIVTKIDLDTIMFTNTLYQWSDYHTRMQTTTKQGDNTYNLRQSLFRPINHDFHQGYDNAFNYAFYSNWSPIERIISPCPNPVDKEWFLQQQPEFDWVMKKRNAETLWDNLGFRIRQFYPHNDLDQKMKRILGKEV